MAKDIIVLGASGHGNVIKDIIIASGHNFIGFLDDNPNLENILGSLDECHNYSACEFIIGIGNNAIRKAISEKYNLKYTTVVHPTAVISEYSKIGAGTVVMPKAVINSKSVIGEHCIINTAAIVEHDNSIGDFTHISPGAVLCGNVKVGASSHLGAGTVVKNNTIITCNVVTGLNTGVIRDIDTPGIYIGTPARLL